jgi:predicted metal-binding membrane protein
VHDQQRSLGRSDDLVGRASDQESPNPSRAGGSLSEAAAFVYVWAVMMVAMMLPSFVPALITLERVARRPERAGGIVLLAAAALSIHR